jgi:hypothetical protein
MIDYILNTACKCVLERPGEGICREMRKTALHMKNGVVVLGAKISQCKQ